MIYIKICNTVFPASPPFAVFMIGNLFGHISIDQMLNYTAAPTAFSSLLSEPWLPGLPF